MFLLPSSIFAQLLSKRYFSYKFLIMYTNLDALYIMWPGSMASSSLLMTSLQALPIPEKGFSGGY